MPGASGSGECSRCAADTIGPPSCCHAVATTLVAESGSVSIFGPIFATGSLASTTVCNKRHRINLLASIVTSDGFGMATRVYEEVSWCQRLQIVWIIGLSLKRSRVKAGLRFCVEERSHLLIGQSCFANNPSQMVLHGLDCSFSQAYEIGGS